MNTDSLLSLYELRLDGSNVKMLPTSIKNLSRLQFLYLDNCKNLGCLPELPPSIKELHADNCNSLVNVSSLKALSQSMKGVTKHILFKNSMKLGGPSLDCVMEDVILTMKSAAFHNILLGHKRHGYSDNNAFVCLPGQNVPRHFKFRKIGSSSSIYIQLPPLPESVGFIFSAVVSSSSGMNEHGNHHTLNCRYWSVFCKDMSSTPLFSLDHLSLDHVFVWYDSNCNIDPSNAFEFTIKPNLGEHNGSYILKECGINPIYYSEFPRWAATMNLDRDLERKIALKLARRFGLYLNESMQLESESIERHDDEIESIEKCDEKESTCIRKNQDLDLNEKRSCSSYDCIIGPLSYLWRLICT